MSLMDMNIGFDYDGTIADTGSVKSAWLKENLGLSIPIWKTDRTSCIKELQNHYSHKRALEIYNDFQKFIYTGEYAKKAPEIPAAIEAIKMLSKNNELWIVTARPSNMIPDVLDWLSARKILSYFKGYLSSGDKHSLLKRSPTKEELCIQNNLDVIIDDDLRHIENIAIPHIKKILLKNGAEEIDTPKGIYVARNFKEVVAHIHSFK